MADVSSYVEQDDQHYGVLTVRETITFAARLSATTFTRAETKARVDDIIKALGLESCQNIKIGTPIQRGVSGGQKRRVTVGCGLVTFPRILFLDEPTSGLDSASAREVMSSIARIAKDEKIIVIATIHAPSMDTLATFSKMMVLAKGRVAFNGTVNEASLRCNEIGVPVPEFYSPADHLLDLVSTDFGDDKRKAVEKLVKSQADSDNGRRAKDESAEVFEEARHPVDRKSFGHHMSVILTLMERTLFNYMRNLLAYGVRLGMYGGMGFLLATIWIRLGHSDSKINDRLAVHFFSVAFLAFMSVAGIPAFLEERSVFLRERRNGLYGPLPFLIANTLLTIPFMFLCTFLFSVIIYWAIGLHPGASHFFRFLAFLFQALLAAEMQVMLISALCPIFIAALALTSFMNGFWMCVQGYFIRDRSLPRFWHYSFHYMDYQAFSFDILVKNDLVGEVFKCDSAFLPDGSCNCVYPASAETIAKYGRCYVSGQDVIDYLEFGGISIGAYAGIVVGIIFFYRLATYLWLRIRR
jgi:ABC-type multidrug transport system ATPase subunit/ABC-type multidrug transport system permease subunit